MIKRCLLLIVLIAPAAGCTDSVDSITREYRNATNEGLDALMLVTSDDKAGRLRRRVFQQLMERFKDIDRRLEIVRTNRTRKEIVEEVYSSDGFQLYLNDLEITRLRNLYKQYIDRQRELLLARGEDATQINGSDVCPELYGLLFIDFKIDDTQSQASNNPLVKQLTEPKLLDMMAQFPSWNLENYGQYYNRLLEKRKAFAPPEFQLAY
jgi:hypothetical protein